MTFNLPTQFIVWHHLHTSELARQLVAGKQATLLARVHVDMFMGSHTAVSSVTLQVPYPCMQ